VGHKTPRSSRVSHRRAGCSLAALRHCCRNGTYVL